MSLRTFNLPPGLSASDLPGNGAEPDTFECPKCGHEDQPANFIADVEDDEPCTFCPRCYATVELP